MPLLSFTASHHDLDLETLERLSSGAHRVVESDLVRCDPISGAVVLATCNRFEVYVDVVEQADGGPVNGLARHHAAREVARVVASSSTLSPDEAHAALTVRAGEDVARHLFSVASGLDSMVVGERQIAGQVKRALEASRPAGTTTAPLERLFQAAARASKRVSNETALSAAGRSLVSLGLDLAGADLPPWEQVRTLLVGTGSYAGASFAALRARGVRDVRVFSRSGRADAFVASHAADGVDVRPADDLLVELEDVDLVVACSGGGRVGDPTASLRPALDAAHVLGARARAAKAAGDDATTRPLVVLDLALTRDVAPQVADVDGVLLYDLAALQARAPHVSGAAVAEAAAIVDHAAEHFLQGEGYRASDASVVELVRAADAEIADLVEQRLAAARAEGVDVDPEEVELAARREVRARLHRDILALRSAAASS
ncbi:glutamyl-tRNA reductase [Luteimicrobium sp. NPDC057192]|uniref:glutamyl-tRNA reductase n=1 Tax=Luteimicrobium sp. NPDC057192 TaxID=3346042 RepID=UPI0036338900